MEAEIRAIPKTLEALYQEVLRGMGPDSLWLTQWVCFATRPLRLDELQWSLTFDPECPQRSIQECRQSKKYVKSLDDVKRQIQTLSCGLVDVTLSDWSNHPLVIPPLTWSDESPTPIVEKCYTAQFIHQPVKDFFINQGLEALDKMSSTPEQAIAVANIRLTKACLYLMTMKEVVEYHAADSTRRNTWTQFTGPDMLRPFIPNHSTSEKIRNELRCPLVKSFPMLGYAASYWIGHAKQACSHERSIIETSWPFELWTSEIFIEMENRLTEVDLIESGVKNRSLCGPTVLHLSVRHGLKILLEVLWDKAASYATMTGLHATIPNFGAIRSTLVEEAARGNYEDIFQMLINGSDNMLADLAHLPAAEGYLQVLHPDSPLSWAARNGNLAIAKLLCERGLVYHHNDYSNALCFAAHGGHMTMVKFLIDKGATPYDMTFHAAVSDRCEDIFRFLLDKYRSEIVESEIVFMLWKTALFCGQYNAMRILLDAFIERLSEESKRQMLLELSGQRPSYHDPSCFCVALALIQAGPVNADYLDWSLVSASGHRDVKFLQQLFEAGADLECSSRELNGSTPLSQAVVFGRNDIVGFLLSQCADPNRVGYEGRPPLLHAVEHGYKMCMKANSPELDVLLDLGADIDLVNNKGQTPILMTVERYGMDGIRYLASRGANMRSKSLIIMALTYKKRADQAKMLEITKLLLELGADVDAPFDRQRPLEAGLHLAMFPVTKELGT